jgi:hypothetical protein
MQQCNAAMSGPSRTHVTAEHTSGPQDSGKVVPVLDYEGIWGTRDIDPLFLTSSLDEGDSTGSYLDSFTTSVDTPVPTGQESVGTL